MRKREREREDGVGGTNFVNKHNLCHDMNYISELALLGLFFKWRQTSSHLHHNSFTVEFFLQYGLTDYLPGHDSKLFCGLFGGGGGGGGGNILHRTELSLSNISRAQLMASISTNNLTK